MTRSKSSLLCKSLHVAADRVVQDEPVRLVSRQEGLTLGTRTSQHLKVRCPMRDLGAQLCSSPSPRGHISARSDESFKTILSDVLLFLLCTQELLIVLREYGIWNAED